MFRGVTKKIFLQKCKSLKDFCMKKDKKNLFNQIKDQRFDDLTGEAKAFKDL